MSKIVAHYMVKSPVTVTENCTLNTVLETLDNHNISHLIVIKADMSLSGIISKEDLLQKIKFISENSSGKTYADFKMNNITAKDLMTTHLITVKKEDPVEYAVELLLQKKFHCLPVVEDSKAVGIITSYDLLKGYYQEHG